MIANGLMPTVDYGNYVDYAIGGGLLFESDPAVPVEAKPPGEYVSSLGALALFPNVGIGRYGPFVRRQPLGVLRAIAKCSAASSSIGAIKAAVLSGGFTFTPAGGPAGAEGEDDPDYQKAMDAADECRRAAESMDQPLESWAWEAMDAIGERVKVAENVLAVVGDGPDKGKYALRAIKHKPRWSWRFSVDRAMNISAIDAWSMDGEWGHFDPDAFTWLAWEPTDGDPRGSSVLDACFLAWQGWLDQFPDFLKGNKEYGTPSLFATTSKLSAKMVPATDCYGVEIPGKPITAEAALSRTLGQRFGNGSVVAAPEGATAKVLESARDNLTIINGLTYCEGLIVKTILLQLRATVEAKHGSRADSETGQDIMGTLVRHIRQWVCAGARRAFYYQLRENHGEDYARRFTPRISLGKTEHQDFAAIAGAVALLYQAGFFAEDQLPWIDDYLGLPMRRPGAARVGPQLDNAGKPDSGTPKTSEPNGGAPKVLDLDTFRASMDEIRAIMARNQEVAA
jgi:hypothetical protein